MADTLALLYCDDDLVVVDKPADLLVHRTSLDRDDDAALQRARDQIGHWLYPVHRLDRPTSGVLVFARSSGAAQRLADDFRSQRVAKHYLAIVRGWAPPHGTIDRPLKPDRNKEPRPSRSRFVCLACAELPIAVSRFPTARYSLVMAAPETGRYHQLRRHLKGIDHPVIGDVGHGDRHHNHFFRAHFDSNRLLLHAWRLALPHPSTRQLITITAPPPASFTQVAEALGCAVDEETLEGGCNRMTVTKTA